MVPVHEAPATVAQPEQRVELLDELECEPPPPQRPDRHRMTRRRARRDLEDRKRDVEAAAYVHEPVIGPGQADVSGGMKLLDQPVLEHQRSQLRARRPVVDDRRVAGPVRPGC